MASNLYRSELRRIPARTISLEDAGELEDVRAADEGPEEEDRDRAVRELVTLPPKYRDAIVLFYFHDMDILAAARSLGVPQGTVKARLSRGREILRNKFARVLKA